MNLVSANVSPTQSIVSGAPIELGFDRLLLPSAVTRQTFIVQDLFGDYLEPSPAYDPVSRVVRLCLVLPPDLTYKVSIVPTALLAIDGAQLSSSSPTLIEFNVAAGPPYEGADRCPQAPAGGSEPEGGVPVDAGVDAAGPGNADAGMGVTVSPPPAVDFCSQVLPIFASKCGGSSCHSSSLPAAGLQMTSAAGIEATAIGRVAQGSNTGSRAITTAPNAGGVFGVDMAIIAPGDPGDSWLLYKLLMADPPPCSSTPGAAPCDAGVATVEDDLWNVPWTPISDSERATLAGYIPGREMPYPTDPNAPLAGATAPLTVDELDLVSEWILQGASVQTCMQ